MVYSLIDRLDEQRAKEGLLDKINISFKANIALVFPDYSGPNTIEDLEKLSLNASNDPKFYFLPESTIAVEKFEDGILRAHSAIQHCVPQNKWVWAKYTKAKNSKHAVLVFHHWRASKRNSKLSWILSQMGYSVLEVALPYHLERSENGVYDANYFVSADVTRTFLNVKQSVLDGKMLVSWLQQEGYKDISVLGMSMGSWIASLVAAHDERISRAALFLAGSSAADLVWTSKATPMIKQSIEEHMTLEQLRRIWAPFDLTNYSTLLTRKGLQMYILLAKRDTVVIPELSTKYIQSLYDSGGSPKIHRLNCGHYTLGKFPFNIAAIYGLVKFLSSS